MPNVIFGDRIYRELISVKQNSKGGTKSSRTDILIRRGRDAENPLHTEGKAGGWGAWGRGGCLQARKRGLTQKPAPAAPWSWTSSPQNCEQVNLCCLNPQDVILGSLRRLTWLLNEPHWILLAPNSHDAICSQFQGSGTCVQFGRNNSPLPSLGWTA